MRYAILGDVHGNLEALDAVLARADALGVDHFAQIGDIVGYGPDPGPCIARLRDRETVIVAGNHDWAVVGKLDAHTFNPYAREAVEWTRRQLDRAELHYLESLPLIQEPDGDFTLAHATVDQPEVFDYIQTYQDAQRSLDELRTSVGFIGHSHVPMSFVRRDELMHTDARYLRLEDVGRALVNVGSVGQPRDENPLAALALFDTRTREYALERVPYDIETTAEKIRRAGLPEVLAQRLFVGR